MKENKRKRKEIKIPERVWSEKNVSPTPVTDKSEFKIWEQEVPRQENKRSEFTMFKPVHIEFTQEKVMNHVGDWLVDKDFYKNGMLNGLEKRKSNIPNSGMGLFNETGKPILADTIIGFYGGKIYFGNSNEEIDEMNNVNLLALQNNTKKFPKSSILTEPSGENLLNFINDCRKSNQEKNQCKGNNCVFTDRKIYIKNQEIVSYDPSENAVTYYKFEKLPIAIVVMSRKTIDVHEELFVDYDESYWTD